MKAELNHGYKGDGAIIGDPGTRHYDISLAYANDIRDGIRALSPNTDGDQDIKGFLYVPEYPLDSSCIDQTSQYIPQNATRMGDIPSVDGAFIALAPWTSPECVLSLFDAVRDLDAFIFYLPNSQPGAPPAVNDPVWGLGDGGRWKSRNKFPVYAIPGPTGTSIMTQLGLYSGSISDAPNGSQLVQKYPYGTDARLYAAVGLANVTSLPSLWAFLLIVLGIVLFMIGFTSGVMHLYQRRRRNTLRRRIVDGEVDLERLGIKRLTVPQEAINMLPTFVYHPSEEELLDISKGHITALSDFPVEESDTTANASPPVEPAPDAESNPAQHPALSPAALPIRSSSEPNQQPSYAQPTCPICLDDFTPQETTVRSLPCHHIYHPECIDPFLLRNSSLCPVCKSKVLPKGYCPEIITNAMDKRRGSGGPDARCQQCGTKSEPVHRGPWAYGKFPPAIWQEFKIGQYGRDVTQPPTGPAAVEMRNMNDDLVPSTASPPIASSSPPPGDPGAPATAPTPPPPPAEPQPEQAQTSPDSTPTVAPNNRSERARRRASIFLREQQPTVEEQEQERWARLPKWRKAIKSLFPGF
ncbi:MAG: hypothetical protein L6R38_001531 [Xanthoria sp. 2 TBL-2021]|nr:MAG: hypothetical protein L6R38_001531 [Xanthoria sp. 2 TBL-2021]